MSGLKILGTGRGLPQKAVSNDDLSRLVDTNDQWISTRTGIRQRYFCQEESCTDLAVLAAQNALQKANIDPEKIGICLVATFSPQYTTPSTACLVQAALGLSEETLCFDINAACSGFIYAMETARGLLQNCEKPYALIIGAEKVTRILDFTDRNTCVLFGDGAGAMVVQLSHEHKYSAIFGARGSVEPISAGVLGDIDPLLKMDGKAIFRFATEMIPANVRSVLQKAQMQPEELSWIVCHQANSRIIDFAAKKLGLPEEMFYKNMERYGNTSSASIPIALDEMWEQGLLKPGSTIVCVGFGAGLTWGAVLLTL